MSFIQDLENNGYAIIENVIPTQETDILRQRLWTEYIEKAWPNIKYNDRSTWNQHFPIHNVSCIVAGPVGQTQVMWDIRQDPRVVNIFSQIWNVKPEELIVSFDGISLMCPPEIRKPPTSEPWPHVDQSLTFNTAIPKFLGKSNVKSDPWTIQGQFLFEDSGDKDGGFYCLPKSHLQFNEFMKYLNTPKNSDECHNSIFSFFKHLTKTHVTAKKGSLILWDSRNVHWNQHPELPRKDPLVRTVGFICYVPKYRLDIKNAILRGIAMGEGNATGHNPSDIDIKATKDHIWKEYLQYLEDSNYKSLDIKLTNLGQKLLGL